MISPGHSRCNEGSWIEPGRAGGGRHDKRGLLFIKVYLLIFQSYLCIFKISNFQNIVVQFVRCICQIELWRPQVVDNWTWQMMPLFAFFVKIENLTSVYSSFFCGHIFWFILLTSPPPKVWETKSQSRARLVDTSTCNPT